MTPLQLEPSAHAPWTSTMFGRAFISVLPSRSGLTAILRSETQAGYPQHDCTSRMPGCAAGGAIPPVPAAGKDRVTPARQKCSRVTDTLMPVPGGRWRHDFVHA